MLGENKCLSKWVWPKANNPKVVREGTWEFGGKWRNGLERENDWRTAGRGEGHVELGKKEIVMGRGGCLIVYSVWYLILYSRSWVLFKKALFALFSISSSAFLFRPFSVYLAMTMWEMRKVIMISNRRKTNELRNLGRKKREIWKLGELVGTDRQRKTKGNEQNVSKHWIGETGKVPLAGKMANIK